MLTLCIDEKKSRLEEYLEEIVSEVELVKENQYEVEGMKHDAAKWVVYDHVPPIL